MQIITHPLLEVIGTLQKNTESIFPWIKNNFLKANPDKSHVVLSDNTERIISILSEDITNTHAQKLLGITIDSSRIYTETTQVVR